MTHTSVTRSESPRSQAVTSQADLTRRPQEDDIKTRTVLFVAQTPKGELAAKLRTTLRGLEGITGFRIKVVSLSALWGQLNSNRIKPLLHNLKAEIRYVIIN